MRWLNDHPQESKHPSHEVKTRLRSVFKGYLSTMDAPCCDVFLIENGKVKSFHCYTAATVLLGQLGVLGNLGASFQK